MIYADVIVGSRTNVQELTYAIPASIIPYIKPGSTVMVPLRRQVVPAVVVGLRQTVPKEVKPLLKDVIEIDKNVTGYTPGQIQTINDLADYYGCSLAEVAYHALVWPQNIQGKNDVINSTKPTFVQALWPDRKKFYLELIIKYSKINNFVFAFGSVEYAADFIYFCKENNIQIIKLGTAKNEKILKNKLINGEIFISAGMQKSSFISLKNNDFLIIDQPDSISYKSQRRPYMSVKRVALLRAKNEGIRLVMGSNLLSVIDYPNRLRKTWRVIEKKLLPVELTIFDRNKTHGSILPGVLEQINIELPTLFLAASKAWAPAMYCKKCGQTIACKVCGRSIAVASRTELGCLYCGNHQPIPTLCPNCHQPELKAIGEGSAQLFEKLENVFGTNKVGLVSGKTKGSSDNGIVVSTEKIMSYPGLMFNAAVVANMDRQLSGTNIDGSWQLLNLLLQLRFIAKQIIVQTHFPEHWVWSAMSTGDLAQYYQNELSTRKEYKLPPYGQKLAILGSGSSVRALQKLGLELSDKIQEALPDLDIGEVVVSYSYGKYYRANAPIFAATPLTAKQKHLLRSLLPASWYLDVEPL